MRHKILAVVLVLALLLGLAGAPQGGITLAGFSLFIYGVVAMVRFAMNLDVQSGHNTSLADSGDDRASRFGSGDRWSVAPGATQALGADGRAGGESCPAGGSDNNTGSDSSNAGSDSCSSDSGSSSD